VQGRPQVALPVAVALARRFEELSSFTRKVRAQAGHDPHPLAICPYSHSRQWKRSTGELSSLRVFSVAAITMRVEYRGPLKERNVTGMRRLGEAKRPHRRLGQLQPHDVRQAGPGGFSTGALCVITLGRGGWRVLTSVFS
jgi:hypothetical protein